MENQELFHLQNKYKQKEKDSLQEAHIPDDCYLCVRLDGFNSTKQYLKDVVINQVYTKCLSDAHFKVFRAFRHHLNKQFTSSIVCSYMANDEISIILNKNNDNYDKRIMKICTLLCGALSSAMTIQMHTETSEFKFTSFDARPIILASRKEIVEYLRSRYLISKKYAYWKILRLNEFEGVYEDNIKNNIDNAVKFSNEYGYNSDALKVISTYKFFLPQKNLKPNYWTIEVDDKSMSIDDLKNSINEYLGYLHQVPRSA